MTSVAGFQGSTCDHLLGCWLSVVGQAEVGAEVNEGRRYVVLIAFPSSELAGPVVERENVLERMISLQLLMKLFRIAFSRDNCGILRPLLQSPPKDSQLAWYSYRRACLRTYAPRYSRRTQCSKSCRSDRRSKSKRKSKGIRSKRNKALILERESQGKRTKARSIWKEKCESVRLAARIIFSDSLLLPHD